MAEPEDLIPHHKFDKPRAEKAIELGYPGVAPILGGLVEWLQDYNWPVAHVLTPFLADLGPVPELVAEIRAALQGPDGIWKYWLLELIVEGWDSDGVSLLRTELEAIVDQPSRWDVEEGVDAIAKKLLDKSLNTETPQ